MLIKSEQLFTSVHPKSVLGKIIQFPIVRILIVAVFIAPFLLFHNNVIADLISSSSGLLHSILVNADAVVSIVIFMLLYALYVRWVEKRKAYEISREKCVMELGWGFFISFALVGFMVLLMSLLGYYRVIETGSPQIIIDSFFFFGMGAFLQVLAFRLVLFRLFEELLGSWFAFVLVAAIFGAAHTANPSTSYWSILALIITDILLVAAFIYTRRIWLVWGIHMGWNFFQDGIFGMPNSGITRLPSWIQPSISGPEWITGGGRGIEASVIAVCLSLGVAIMILKMAIEKKQIISPVWKR
ncbi:MAG: type II CAAX endopeptidase family protein [Candidatus Aminicenantes bacterium]|jgi:membrane protease YdiL (CAAX protease family)